ncbi:hypothetical protein O3Q52_22020, partial [Streptomyces sp. ActVer]|nr:hypothetical protein [Streptomyces sp. ActVer]
MSNSQYETYGPAYEIPEPYGHGNGQPDTYRPAYEDYGDVGGGGGASGGGGQYAPEGRRGPEAPTLPRQIPPRWRCRCPVAVPRPGG